MNGFTNFGLYNDYTKRAASQGYPSILDFTNREGGGYFVNPTQNIQSSLVSYPTPLSSDALDQNRRLNIFTNQLVQDNKSKILANQTRNLIDGLTTQNGGSISSSNAFQQQSPLNTTASLHTFNGGGNGNGTTNVDTTKESFFPFTDVLSTNSSKTPSGNTIMIFVVVIVFIFFMMVQIYMSQKRLEMILNYQRASPPQYNTYSPQDFIY
jgi:hypothetical protein